MGREPLLFFFIILPVLFGCKPASRISVNTALPAAVVQRNEQILIPTDTAHAYYDGIRMKALVQTFYSRRDGKSAWLNDRYEHHLCDTIIQFLKRLEYYALPSSRYHLKEISMLTDSSAAHRIKKELLLSDAFLLLASDLKHGLSPSGNTPDSVRLALLTSVFTGGELAGVLRPLEPTVHGYLSLKGILSSRLSARSKYAPDSGEIQKEIEVISVNLERWRRETHSLEGRYILINIPAFALDVVENDSIVLTSRVIVGTAHTKTPVLSSTIECISVYPYWHVPRKISIEEYLPQIQKDTSFIGRNNFDVLDRHGNLLHAESLPWSQYHAAYFPVVLRQREGADNALGIVKFVFDNPYAVYLHDTNAKRLFNSQRRAFSHGCVRMEKAVDLAHLLVTGSPQIKSRMLSRYLREKQQHWIELRNPIPIHIRYFTAECREGSLITYDDVYNFDPALRDILFPENRTAGF